MPIVVPVDHLESGMRLASSLRNRYSVLLPAYHVLTERDIENLRSRFSDKLIQVTDPLLDELLDFGDTSHDEGVSNEVRRSVAGVSQRISQQVRSGSVLRAENVAGMARTVAEMMEYLQKNPVTMACLEQSNNWDEYLQEHAANVFYLSLVVGNTIRNYIKRERERLTAARSLHNAMDLTPLATAALLHDIGMSPLERLYHKAEPLTPEERRKVHQHPIEGAAMLPDKIDPMVSLIVRSHHENQMASGYPDQLSPEKVNVFARVLRVADAYSAAISATAYRPAHSPLAVLYEMLHGASRRLYDPVILKVFSGVVQPLPIGAKLALESGQTAVVTGHKPRDPFHPKIVVAFDVCGDYLPPEQIRGPFFLGEEPDVRVIRFGDQDISFLNEPEDAHAAHAPVEVPEDDLIACFYP